MTGRIFTQDQLDDAIDYVVEEGAVDRAQTISYSRVFASAGMEPPQDLHNGGDGQLVTAFMEAFHSRCQERGCPPLDALVVHTAGSRNGEPGSGYYRINGHSDPHGRRVSIDAAAAALNLWRSQREECAAWGTSVRRGKISMPAR
jgi:hypothetical protein